MDLNSFRVKHHEVEHANPATWLSWSLVGTQDFHPSLSMTWGFCDAHTASGDKEGDSSKWKRKHWKGWLPVGEKEKAHFPPHEGKLLADCFRQYTEVAS